VQPDDLRAVSDAQLVVAVGRFHQDALAEAYRRHAGAAFGLAMRIVNERSFAEEVVQEVFLRLWNEPEKFVQSRQHPVVAS
jgi:RNA polymerase sigma-70 factor, ECF subfamily